MNETTLAVLSALAILISAASGLYVAITTAKAKKAESAVKRAEIDDIYSQITERIQKTYVTLLGSKDHAIDNLEIRISSLEQDRQVNKGQIKFLLKYIGYLLEEIRNDKSGSFTPVTMDAYRLACEAGL